VGHAGLKDFTHFLAVEAGLHFYSRFDLTPPVENRVVEPYVVERLVLRAAVVVG